MNEQWKDDAELAWELLSWEGEAQWFASKEEAGELVTAATFTLSCGVRMPATKRVMGGRLRSLDSLIGTIRNAEALGWNLYLNLNPTRAVPGKKKLSREDVTHWRYVLADLDPGGEALVPPNPDCGDPLSGCTGPSMYLRHAHRIFTGRGYHYWLPVKMHVEDFDRHPPAEWDEMPLPLNVMLHKRGPLLMPLVDFDAERIMQGYLKALAAEMEAWAPGWIVDTACSDLARVVRCPGSVNQRTGRRATVEFVAPGNGVDISILMQYNTPVVLQETGSFTSCETTNLLDVLPHLNVRSRTFIIEGTASPGRHSACYATCKSLHELRVPAARAVEWLMVGAGRCWQPTYRQGGFERQEKPLDEQDVRNTVRQVYGK